MLNNGGKWYQLKIQDTNAGYNIKVVLDLGVFYFHFQIKQKIRMKMFGENVVTPYNIFFSHLNQISSCFYSDSYTRIYQVY